ncbi:apelin receptor-like [Ornithorhynchus anatinus]|uniref:apelin receptor-like n=1 Tax=Ornithorhynchus anatinus TaxID=9258 RepID=UPI0010A7975D|nr:apelin receptor-like [Ornithorhynchus anatinus]
MEPWTADPQALPLDDYYDYYNGSGGGGLCPGEEEGEADWELSYSLLPVLYMLVFVLGLSGNGIVIFTVWRAPGGAGGGTGGGGWRSADTYIGNLALADLAFVVTLPLWAAYTALRFHWPFGSVLCKLSSYLVLLNMFASAFCLSCLSFERYLAVVHSLSRARLLRSRRAATLLSLGALWLLAGLLALPALLLRDTQRRPPLNATVCDMDYSRVASPEQERYWLGALSLGTTALGFVLPLLLMTVFYCCLGGAVTRHFQHLKKEEQKRRRLLRIIAALVAVFALCWLPFHLLKGLYVLGWLGLLDLPCAAQDLIVRLHPYATCLAYVNSCLNPFLYAFLDLRFRARCLRLLGLRRPRPRRPSASLSSTASAQTQKSELPSLATKV